MCISSTFLPTLSVKFKPKIYILRWLHNHKNLSIVRWSYTYMWHRHLGKNGVVREALSGKRFVCCTLTVVYSIYNMTSVYDLSGIICRLRSYILAIDLTICITYRQLVTVASSSSHCSGWCAGGPAGLGGQGAGVQCMWGAAQCHDCPWAEATVGQHQWGQKVRGERQWCTYVNMCIRTCVFYCTCMSMCSVCVYV